MTNALIEQTQAYLLAGDIAEAETHLVAYAENAGDHALVAVLDEMAPKDVLSVMREFDSTKESLVNLLVSPEQFVAAIVLEHKYGEPIERYVPRLRNTMNAVLHRNAATCVEALECLSEHKEGIRVLADYFTDHYEEIQNLAYKGVFYPEVDVEKAFAPKSVTSWDPERIDDFDQGLEMGEEVEMVRVRLSRAEVSDGDWMETAWVLRHEFEEAYELLVIEIQDRIRRQCELNNTPLPPSPAEPGTPGLEDEEEESAI